MDGNEAMASRFTDSVLPEDVAAALRRWIKACEEGELIFGMAPHRAFDELLALPADPPPVVVGERVSECEPRHQPSAVARAREAFCGAAQEHIRLGRAMRTGDELTKCNLADGAEAASMEMEQAYDVLLSAERTAHNKRMREASRAVLQAEAETGKEASDG